MSKKCYRFFGGLLRSQTRWLNSMAEKGFRLVRTSKLLYEFIPCKPKEFEYCVEFVGDKSKQNVADYKNFLEDMGYNVFFKNINLNYSVDKIRWRPWAEKGGRIATNSTTFNRELLIVEKINDGKPFELHTTHEDQVQYMRTLRSPWLSMLVLFFILGILMKSAVFVVFAIISLVPVAFYQMDVMKLEKEAKTQEW